jgi:hypothetical protein
MEEEFREYLKGVKNQQGNYFTNEKIDEFINDLKKTIPSHIGNNVSLLTINDIQELDDIKSRLVTNGDLYHFHKGDGNGRPSSALKHYIDFLRGKEILLKPSINLSNKQGYI